MSAYMVSYDLIKRKDYPELWDALKAYGTYAHILGSSWIIVSSQSANEICTALLKHVDNDDKIIVTEVTSNSAWSMSFPETIRKWLRKHLWGQS